MLIIYLFSVSGQLVLHQYFSYLSERFFNEQIAKGFYNKDDLTEVKIPVNMPNVLDWPAYENISGQIQFGNTSYNYVKMRVTRTALYLMCVPNYETTKLASQNLINAKSINGNPVPPKNHVPFGKILLLTNINFPSITFTFSPPLKCPAIINVQSCDQMTNHSRDTLEQPPKSCC